MEINGDWADPLHPPNRVPPKEDRLWAHPSEYRGAVKGHGKIWAGILASMGLVLIGLVSARMVWPSAQIVNVESKPTQSMAIGASTSSHIQALARSIVKISVPGKSRSFVNGLVISPAGYILVPANSLPIAKSYAVEIWGIGTLKARFVDQDKSTDTALIQVNRKLTNYISEISHRQAKTGEMTIAIGPSSANSRNKPTLAISQIQTTGISQLLPGGQNSNGAYLADAAQKINPTGMLFVNSQGIPLGIGLYKLNTGWIVSPLSTMLIAANKIELSNGVPKGWLGIVGTSMENSATSTSISIPHGVYVFSVTPHSPAYNAGILPKDEIVAVDRQAVSSLQQLQNDLSNLPSGTQVTLTVIRNGQSRQINTKLGVKSTSQSR